MVKGIDIRHVHHARLMRPEPIRILSKKVVVVTFINDDGYLRCIGRTFGREITHDNPRIIPYHARNEIWARFRIRVGKFPIARSLARLVKGDIAFLILTPAELFLIENIHRVGETIVRSFESRIQIPASRFVVGLRPCERRYTRALV